MKAISLWQPWATLVSLGAKQIETRSWSTDHRGLLAIHAAKHFTSEERGVCEEDPFYSVLTKSGFGWDTETCWRKNHQMLPLGAIVAVADLRAVYPTEHIIRAAKDRTAFLDFNSVEKSFGDFSPGRFGWILAEVKRLRDPIPCRGARQLWDVPGDVETKIREALGC